MKKAFDNQQYIKIQTQKILERIDAYDNKLYLEFGGKLFDDLHASRVLPGFEPDCKVKILQVLKDQTEIIVVINANDIERKKIRADFGITYDADILRLIDNLRSLEIYVSSIVITQYTGQPAADIFKKKLEMRGERVYLHRNIAGYPNDVNTIVSEDGYGKNDFVETTRPLVVVTAPGPGSGKLATCLSQLYHEHKRNVRAGYAKFETFPIWNLPLKHPVNIAYEAATADLKDINMIDHFHLAKYGVPATNYNRDIEAFPVVKTIMERIMGTCPYFSPTDMGVNAVGFAISDDEAACEASKQEVLRRYYRARCDYKLGTADISVAQRIEVLMQDLGVTVADRPVIASSLKRAEETGMPSLSLQMPDGTIITGKRGAKIGAPAAAILNAVKYLSDIRDDLALISPAVIDPMIRMKADILGSTKKILNLEEALLALSISALTNPTAELAMKQLPLLRGVEGHYTKIPSPHDEATFRKLGIRLTSEDDFGTTNLFIQ